MRVNVRHINISAVKNNYNGKTLQALGEEIRKYLFCLMDIVEHAIISCSLFGGIKRLQIYNNN